MNDATRLPQSSRKSFRLDIRSRTLFVGIPTTVISLMMLLAVSDEARMLTAAVLAIANIAVWFLVILWNRDTAPPIFEVGTICVGFTALYSIYPLFAFLMAGGIWTPLSDSRLQQWTPDMHALGRFAWRYVAYLGAFAGMYLALRGRASATAISMRPLSRSGALVVVWLFLALTTYFAALLIVYGVSYDPSYQDVQLGLVGVSQDLPYLLQQISHNLRGVLVILKICGVALLMHSWRSPLSRTLLAIFLVAEVVATGFRMGARSDTVILLIAVALLYHRIVCPLSTRIIAAAGVGLLCLALLYGFARDFARAGTAARSASYWSAANEFQILMGTGYDLHMRNVTGALPPVPWQVHASDLLRLIPSQALPVAKVEPADWYLEQLKLQGKDVGLMFGVTAQSVIGYDWIDLVARGALLGALFAVLHRLYVANATSFWASVLYLYVCLWSYYTFRASTFYFLYVILYRFLPTMIAVRVGAGLVRQVCAKYAPAQQPATLSSSSCAES